MARTLAQALNYANSVSTGYGGLCLQFVRTCFGVGAKYPSAIAAWNGAQYKHQTSSTSGIPVGAPIFFAGSKYGHVAVYAGNGNMRTTNSATNRIHTMTVASWVRAGYHLLGWTEDINGVRIYGGGGNSEQSAGGLKVDGVWGAETTKALQRVLGTPVDGVISEQYPHPQITAITSVGWKKSNPQGSQMVYRLQQKIGVHADGLLGPNTIKALQRYLGTPQDGIISVPSQMVIALQKRLNSGSL